MPKLSGKRSNVDSGSGFQHGALKGHQLQGQSYRSNLEDPNLQLRLKILNLKAFTRKLPIEVRVYLSHTSTSPSWRPWMHCWLAMALARLRSSAPKLGVRFCKTLLLEIPGMVVGPFRAIFRKLSRALVASFTGSFTQEPRGL